MEEAAKILDLTSIWTATKALSGGQRQRIAMGRYNRPQAEEAFLMDELSNLDAKARVQTRTQIAKHRSVSSESPHWI